MRFAFLAKLLLVLLASFAVVACGSSGKKKQRFAYVERPVEILYDLAVRDLERKRYDRAIAYFEEVERQHPYSSWARRAMLMKAFAYYQGNDYEEAVTALDQFIALHPGNKDIPYAYYLKAMCHYERIRDVGRDQEFTNNAVETLTDVVRRYPNTEYARDARLKLDLTYDHLAGKEMYIGRFYLKQNKHIAAINRFKKVINDYQTTSHVPEALHRLTEAYLELGIIEEARAAAAVLGYNYPGSRWYQDSYKLFEQRDLVAEGSEQNRRKPRKLEKVERNAPSIEDIDPDELRALEPPSPSELERMGPSDNITIDATADDN
ncbi:MAG: outer membrane protein assembly factor BamD [Parvularcula sp.]|uniref:outer membrane protein assembly factor BamD n=1 Tax=Hyphococcus sp. TaxID=2038636 RepID=UPI000C3CA3BA|nr:outer membrane protein assembly factor BamD [Parvularcula sp.]